MTELWWLIGLVGVFVIAQIAVGVQTSQQTGRISRALLLDAKRRARRSFTVVVRLDRRAEVLYPFLDHIGEHHYPKVEVLVVVQHTAGKNAQRQIRAYGHKNNLSIRAIRYQKGLSMAKVVQRYCKTDYTVSVPYTVRFGAAFFDIASQIIKSEKPNAILIRRHIRPVVSFRRALLSLGRLFSATGRQVSNKRQVISPEDDYVLFKTKAVTQQEALSAKPILYDRLFVDTSYNRDIGTSPIMHISGVLVASATLLVAGYSALSWLMSAYEAQVYTVLLLNAVVLFILALMITIRGYKPLDYLNMALFVPIAPLYALGQLILTVIPRRARSARRSGRR